MLTAYLSSPSQELQEVTTFQKGCWVNLVAPTEAEINRVIKELNIYPNFVYDLLDVEEKARIEIENDQVLIIIDIPVVESESKKLLYDTIPLGIIITNDYIVTFCLTDNQLLRDFQQARIKEFYTFKKTRFVLQMLLRTASYYLRYLRDISKKTDYLEAHLRRSMENNELFDLLDLQKSLVYFTTSLKSNEVVMTKLLNLNVLKMYEEDQDVLEDAIVENRQAIEMANIHTNILTSMMGTFASVISNNLNLVMRFLASITIVLSFPTMMASFFGMNVPLPLSFENYNHAFLVVFIISLILSSISLFFLSKKKML